MELYVWGSTSCHTLPFLDNNNEQLCASSADKCVSEPQRSALCLPAAEIACGEDHVLILTRALSSHSSLQ